MAKIQWTKEQLDIIRREYPEHGARKLAERLGCNDDSIYFQAQRMKVKHDPSIRRKKEDAIIREYVPKIGGRRVAEMIGRGPDFVYKRSRELGVERPTRKKYDKIKEDEQKKPFGFSGANAALNIAAVCGRWLP